jgi:hypothetical protein
MICFLDKTFCKNPECDCTFPKWSEELSQRAEKWWNPNDNPDKRGKAPVAFVMHEETT